MRQYMSLWDAMETSSYDAAAHTYGLGEVTVQPNEEGPGYTVSFAPDAMGNIRYVDCADQDTIEAALNEVGMRARMDGWYPIREEGAWGDEAEANA